MHWKQKESRWEKKKRKIDFPYRNKQTKYRNIQKLLCLEVNPLHIKNLYPHLYPPLPFLSSSSSHFLLPFSISHLQLTFSDSLILIFIPFHLYPTSASPLPFSLSHLHSPLLSIPFPPSILPSSSSSHLLSLPLPPPHSLFIHLSILLSSPSQFLLPSPSPFSSPSHFILLLSLLRLQSLSSPS